jgi:hypothetical protein
MKNNLLLALRAAVNLYGAISQARFLEIYNRLELGDSPATEADLAKLKLRDEYFDLEGNYYAHEILLTEEEDTLEDLLVQQRGKTFYVPDRTEFLKFEDDLYYERTEAFEQLLAFLKKEFRLKAEKAGELCEDIQLVCAEMTFSIGVVMFEFERRQIVFEDEAVVNRLMPLIMEVANHSRLWTNCGHTPREVREQSSGAPSSARPSSFADTGKPAAKAAAAWKTGRNDPCPCGSGKKYKNCCG